jgi:hypothetical protein
MRNILCAMAMVVGLTACETEATRANNRVEHAKVTCYSGGQVIYKDSTPDWPHPYLGEPGTWEFMDSNDNLVRVSGDCVVTN